MPGRALTRAVTREAASILAGRLDVVTGRIAMQLGQAFPELVADADMSREFDASVRANIATGLAVLAGDAPAATTLIPEQATGFARTLVHRQVGLDRLLEVYRVGHARVWRTWMDVVAERADDRELLVAALQRSADDLDRFVTRLVSLLVEEFQREQRRWTRLAAARRSDTVQRILGETGIDVDEASGELGHELRAVQTALVAWSELPESALAGSERIGRAATALLASLGVARALMVPIGASSVWIWIASPSGFDPAQLRDAAERAGPADVRFACGASGAGIEGFRSSHRQALRAQRVARRLALSERLTSYVAIGAIAVITDDDDAVRDFVGRELGQLGRHPTLCRTVASYLAAGGNAPVAAAELGTHRNTVLYRLRRAEELLGRRLGERRLELELSLRLLDTLGDRGPELP